MLSKQICVIKRNGTKSAVDKSQIRDRLSEVWSGLTAPDRDKIDLDAVSSATYNCVYDGITTRGIEDISASVAEDMSDLNAVYSEFASRIYVANLHKSISRSFSAQMEVCATTTGVPVTCILEYIRANSAALDAMINLDNDYTYTYVGLKCFEKFYLLRDTVPVECPQYTLMRVALSIFWNHPRYSAAGRLEMIAKCYARMSAKQYTHGSPGYFSACKSENQFVSCFLYGPDDTLESVIKTKSNIARINNASGGSGIYMTDLRSAGSRVSSTGGVASGVARRCVDFDATLKTCCGLRASSGAIYLEPHHADIREFLQLKLSAGDHNARARYLWYGIWHSDLIIRRCILGENISLFCPATAPGLSDVYDGMEVCSQCGWCTTPSAMRAYIMHMTALGGSIRDCPDLPACGHESGSDCMFTRLDGYTLLYEAYERAGKQKLTVAAVDIFKMIAHSMAETGVPYTLFKDACNRGSNQKNIGTIKSSNLCTEIIQWSSADSYACCVLASINLQAFLRENKFDYDEYRACVADVVEILDSLIDVNVFPSPECKTNAASYRPIGVGVQGLAEVFAALGCAFDSPEAAAVDAKIFEHHYYAAMESSARLARTRGSYEGFAQSPAARGELQPDLWNKYSRCNYEWARDHGVTVAEPLVLPKQTLDFNKLRDYVRGGLRNSLTIALPPTATTSMIFQNTESFEPFQPLVSTKSVTEMKLRLINRRFQREMEAAGKWTHEFFDSLIVADGSIANTDLPADLRNRYKTIFEISQREIIRRSAIRQAYVCQSQSLNLSLSNNSEESIFAAIIYGWSLSILKTGSYYIRTNPAAKPVNIIRNSKRAPAEKITFDICTSGGCSA